MSAGKIWEDVLRDSARAYFAPLVGAFTAIRREARHMERRKGFHKIIRTKDSFANTNTVVSAELLNFPAVEYVPYGAIDMDLVHVTNLGYSGRRVLSLQTKSSNTLTHPDIKTDYFVVAD